MKGDVLTLGFLARLSGIVPGGTYKVLLERSSGMSPAPKVIECRVQPEKQVVSSSAP